MPGKICVGERLYENMSWAGSNEEPPVSGKDTHEDSEDGDSDDDSDGDSDDDSDDDSDESSGSHAPDKAVSAPVKAGSPVQSGASTDPRTPSDGAAAKKADTVGPCIYILPDSN